MVEENDLESFGVKLNQLLSMALRFSERAGAILGTTVDTRTESKDSKMYQIAPDLPFVEIKTRLQPASANYGQLFRRGNHLKRLKSRNPEVKIAHEQRHKKINSQHTRENGRGTRKNLQTYDIRHLHYDLPGHGNSVDDENHRKTPLLNCLTSCNLSVDLPAQAKWKKPPASSKELNCHKQQKKNLKTITPIISETSHTNRQKSSIILFQNEINWNTFSYPTRNFSVFLAINKI